MYLHFYFFVDAELVGVCMLPVMHSRIVIYNDELRSARLL